MSLLASFTVKAKFYLAVALISTVAIVVGGAGLWGLNNANEQLKTVYEDRVVPLKQLKIVSDLYAVNIVDTCHKVRNGNLSWADGIKNIDEAAAGIKKEWGNYTATKLVEKEERLVKDIQPLLQTASSSTGKARDIMQRQDREALTAYTVQELYNAIDPVTGKISDLIDVQLEVAQQEYETGRRKYEEFRLAFIVLLAGGISAAVGLAIGIGRMLVSQIDTMVASINKNEQGLVTVKEFQVTSQDELGYLGENLNTLIKQVREFVRQIAAASDMVSSSGQQLTASAGQSAQASGATAMTVATVASGMERQMLDISRTVESIEVITEQIQEIAQGAGSVAAVTEQTAAAAQSGTDAVMTAVTQMKIIEQAVTELAVMIGKLGLRSREIGRIIETIAQIAGQTNLLALNAAIEAARAGEQGRGFAVVADEVRKLAEQSEQAARQISLLIKEIQQETESAVAAMDKGTAEVKTGNQVVHTAGQAFTEINDLVKDVLQQVQGISRRVQQAAIGSQSIVTTVRSIDAVSKDTAAQMQTVSANTEQQAAAAQEIASSSQVLVTMASDMQQEVNKFVI